MMYARDSLRIVMSWSLIVLAIDDACSSSLLHLSRTAARASTSAAVPGHMRLSASNISRADVERIVRP